MRLSTREAVALAKRWLVEQLAEEQLEDVGLEEVKYDDGFWEITLGFSRPWDRRGSFVTQSAGLTTRVRTYKVLSVADESGEVMQMRNREAA